MEKQYRIGIIGHTGKGNYGHGVDSVWNNIAGWKIISVSDANDDGRAAAKERLGAERTYKDYNSMLAKEQLDIVSVCPRWVDQHRDMIMACVNRGIHVYTEKPFCRDLEEADEIVKACEEKNIKLAIAHQTRYSPIIQVIKGLIDDGRIGRLLELRGRGKEDHRGGGEDLWVLGSHIFNLMHYFGGEPNWCFGNVLENHKPVTAQNVIDGNEGIGPLAGDSITATYGMNDSVRGFFATNRAAHGRRFGLQIFGSNGVIEVVTGYIPNAFILEDPMWSPGRSGGKWKPITTAGIDKPEPMKDGGLQAGNIAACADLVNAIEEDREPECNVHEARTTIEMIAAVFESHRQQKPVSMPLESRKNPLKLLA